MRQFDANSWEILSIPKSSSCKKKKEKKKHRHNRRNKIDVVIRHNAVLKSQAEKYVNKMRNNPSELEKKMIEFLDHQEIDYDFQKVLYIKDKDGKITHYFIADFYIWPKNIILETDGKFHDNQKEYDAWRTECIQDNWKNMEVVRWRWNDFRSYVKMKELVQKLK